MEKIPMLPIADMALDVWYEGPGFVVADKPQGMSVHPGSPAGNDTLVNGLLQSNRWLAEMENSHTPGVIHQLMPADRGLVVVAKSDDMATALRELHRDRALMFSYRVRLPQEVVPLPTALVTVRDRQVYDQVAVWDIDSPLGDTDLLRAEWLGDVNVEAYFVAYRVDLPAPDKHVQVGLGDRLWLPAIDLYTVPPCSICNGTKALLSSYGFGYRDHSLDNDAAIAEMRRLRGPERGIPVIVINGVVSVGFDRHRLKHTLGLY